MIIDLNEYRTPTSKVFSGRDRGKIVRKELNLDAVDLNKETVEIIVPDDIYTINTSFFLGAFGKSVRELGKSGFKDKYIFHCKDIIKEDIKEGIERALKVKSVV